MSKLSHSHQESMDEIERRRLKAEGFFKCETCHGAGVIWEHVFHVPVLDAPLSGSDPCCPDCDGAGYLVE